ncbi:putative poly polymerase 2 [Echria macrotheca]|uniref:Poly [ADP-ribose] polymerase n=1 Tax=Echria macrotheca TaxID=438768 RepID=A0AAJ0B3H9_9PEZI|nr:putative poly polymerase 2 [Echria macrotheca]
MALKKDATSTSSASRAKSKPLGDCKIVFSTSVRKQQNEWAIKRKARGLGAKVVRAISAAVTHLVVTPVDPKENPSRLSKAVALGIRVVTVGWILKCVTDKAKAPEEKFLVGAELSDKTGLTPSRFANSLKRARSPDAKADLNSVSKKRKGDGGVEAVDDPEVKDKEEAVKVQVPLIEGCPHTDSAVYIDPNGVIFDATLNKVDIKGHRQILVDPTDPKYPYRFYRTSTSEVYPDSSWTGFPLGPLSYALDKFERYFEMDTGLEWSNRHIFPSPGQFAFVEHDYGAASDEKKESKTRVWSPPQCTLDPAVQELAKVILSDEPSDHDPIFESNYEPENMPLGRLSKRTVALGFRILRGIHAVIVSLPVRSDSEIADVVNKAGTKDETLLTLSNLFYSVIPHNFGARRPHVIASKLLVQREIVFLNSLPHQDVFSNDEDRVRYASYLKFMNQMSDVELPDIHPLDRKYQRLNLDEMTLLSPASAEYSELIDYLGTRSSKTNPNHLVKGIFRIERRGEKDRFIQRHGEKSCQCLLWHGSRVGNFEGILKDGLHIAPSWVPNTGTCFGEGIYLADASCKSAKYCNFQNAGEDGFLLLCQAELGNPRQTLIHPDSKAGDRAKAQGVLSTEVHGTNGPAEWKDAACVHPSLKGVHMAGLFAGYTKRDGAYLNFNEYVCYNVAQVRLRYLFHLVSRG